MNFNQPPKYNIESLPNKQIELIESSTLPNENKLELASSKLDFTNYIQIINGVECMLGKKQE